jgi:serine O-acetyltransferase
VKRSQFNYLRYDLYRYFYPNNEIKNTNLLEKIKIIIVNQGLWAIVVYRFRRWYLYECNNKIFRFFFKPVGLILQLLIEIMTGIRIEPEIDIGPGLYVGHFGNIFLGGNTKIGKFFNVSQGCTSGYAGRGERWGLPQIGDFVYMAPGAKAIGKIKIGNHVAIGANSVVTRDLPDNAVAVGIPATVKSYKSSCDFVKYNKDKNKEIL